jgi:filamentous hemagglutinin family protein
MNKNLHPNKHNQSHLLALNVIGAAVASCFGATALAAGTGGQFVNGTGSITTQGNLQTIINSPNAIINWQTFSSGTSEFIRFNQQSASSAVLNRVIGADPSVLLGTLQSNGRVFIINPNGILFGASSVVDVNGLVASTLNITDADFKAGKLNFVDAGAAGAVVNQGSIRTPAGGSVYLIAPDVTNTGLISSPQGEVVLAAGHSVQLVDAHTPELQVRVDSGDGSAVNLGQIIAHSGSIGIYGALITQGGKLDADTAVVGQDGSITLQASQDINLLAGGVTTASGGAGKAEGGEIHIIADGTLNVASGADIHVDGGKLGGDAGLLEVSGKQNLILDGNMTGKAVAGYKGGNLVIDPVNIVISNTGPGTITHVGPVFSASSGTTGALLINPTALKTFADTTGWATITLDASNDITVASAIGTAVARFDHGLTMNAGNDIDINADIFLGTTRTLSLQAGNDITIAPLSTSALNVNVGALQLGAGNDILIGGSTAAAKTNIVTTGNLTALAASDLTIAAGNVTANNGEVKDTSVTLTVGANADLEADVVTIAAGNVNAFATGVGTHTATAAGNVTLSVKGNLDVAGKSHIHIYGGSADALAYVSDVTGTGLNTAKADAKVTIAAGGNMALAGGSANQSHNGYVQVNAGNASAHAFNYGQTTGRTIAGTETAAANANVSITAGGALTVSSQHHAPASPSPSYSAGTFGVYLRGGHTSASALNKAQTGNNIKVTGTNNAAATASLALKATTGDLKLTTTSGDVIVSASKVSASAYNSASGLTNTVSGNNSAKSVGGITLSAGGNVNIAAAGNLNIDGSSAKAKAKNQIVNGNTAKITGNNTVGATNGVTITAAGNVTLAAGNNLGISAVGSGFASAFNDLGIGVKNAITGTNTANATNAITITAGKDLNITGSGVGGVGIHGNSAQGFAFNEAADGSAAGGGKVIIGNNVANGTVNVALKAGGAISLTAGSGPVSISADGNKATASAFNFVNGSNALAANGNKTTGNNTATATNNVTLTAGTNLTIRGQSGVSIYGMSTSPVGFALNFANGINSKAAGNNSAKATSRVALTAPGTISISASNGFVSVDALGAARSKAFNRIAGGGLDSITGNNTAVGANTISITAGKDLTIAGYDGVSILGNNNNGGSITGHNAFTSAYNSANGQQQVITGNNTVNATNGITLTAPTSISLTATNGDVLISANGSAQAIAHNFNAGNNNALTANKVTGNNSGTASNKVGLKTSGGITVSGKNVYIYGNKATGSAFNYQNGNFNKITGNNAATAGVSVSLDAGKSVNIIATDGSASISADGFQNAKANNVAYGNNNTTLGNNTANVSNAVSIKALGDISVKATNGKVGVFGSGGTATGGTASAYTAVYFGRSTNSLVGNNTATVKTAVSLTAGGNISLAAEGTNGSVYIAGNNSARAFAYHSASGNANTLAATNTATNSNTVTLTAGKDLSVKGKKVNITNSYASAEAYNDAGPGITGNNKLTGANKATAKSNVSLTAAGAVNLAATNGNLSIYTSNGAFTSAWDNGNAAVSNTLTAPNTAVADNSILIKAAKNVNMAAHSGNVYIATAGSGGSAFAADKAAFLRASLGANTAKSTSTITVSAGGNLTVAADNGDVSIYTAIRPSGFKASAFGQGVNTATASNDVTLTATGNVSLRGDIVGLHGGYYLGSASANGSAATAVNNATASANLTIKGANIALSAENGGVNILGSSGASAHASGSGKNTATANANTVLTATGTTTATGTVPGRIDIVAIGGDVAIVGAKQNVNQHLASASGALATAVNTATAHSDVSITGGTVAIASAAGNVYIGANSIGDAGNAKATVAGVGATKALSTSDVKVTSSKLILAGDNVYIDGGVATFTGATAKAEAATLLKTATANIATINDFDLTAGTGKYDYAGLVVTTSLTMNLGHDLLITGGANDFSPVVTDSNFYVGITPKTTATQINSSILGTGITDSYTLTQTGNLNQGAAFIKYK